MGVGAKNMKNPIFLASRALIKNRLDESSNLAHRDMHAKFGLIWIIRLLRAMGVVRKLTLYLIIGGNLYRLNLHEKCNFFVTLMSLKCAGS